ncbi:hypothetical protein [Streptomyces gardneri]|uniref:hypothetical protein n=1 Tax=Streptomyces gardneri TaxID=66892 RepID=UPI0035DEDC58
MRGTAESTGRRVPLHEVRLLAPVSPGKIVAVGRNYADHIAELSLDTPAAPRHRRALRGERRGAAVGRYGHHAASGRFPAGVHHGGGHAGTG